MLRRPAPRSVTSLVLALLTHAAAFGIVLAVGMRPPAPRAPDDPDEIPRITSFPRRPAPPAAPRGGARPPRPAKSPRAPTVTARPQPPEPVPPTAVPQEAPPPEAPVSAEPAAEGGDPSGAADGAADGTGEPGGEGGSGGEGEGGDGDGLGGNGADASEPVVYRSDMTRPRIVHRVDAEYPRLARSLRREGTVVLNCLIEVDGSVRVVGVHRSVALLDEAAIDAVRQWRYEPARWNGRAQAVYFFVRVDFKLR